MNAPLSSSNFCKLPWSWTVPESRAVLAAGPFHAPLFQTGTGLHETDASFTLEMADYNQDGKQDMFAIKKWWTGTGMTEIFVYSGQHNFDSRDFGSHAPFMLSVGTALPATNADWDFRIANWDGGVPDLMGIHKANTPSGFVELHVLRGENAYQSVTRFVTPLPTPNRDWSFDFADLAGDGYLDMFGILRNGTNSTELHVVNGAPVNGIRFSTMAIQTATSLHQVDSSFDFSVVDIDASRGFPDLVAIKKANTDSGRTEVHVIDGRVSSTGIHPYGWFSHRVTTNLHVTGHTFEFDIEQFSSNSIVSDGFFDLVAFKKSGTGTGSTEVHAFSGANLPLPNDAEVPITAGSNSEINYSIPSSGTLILNFPAISTNTAPAQNSGTITGGSNVSVTVTGHGQIILSGAIAVGDGSSLSLASQNTKVTLGAPSNNVPGGIMVAGTLAMMPMAELAATTPVQVAPQGALAGSGKIKGPTSVGTQHFVSGALAILTPGFSPGPITIDNLTMNAGSLYVAEIDGERSDVIISSNPTLNNPRLRIDILNTPIPGSEYV